MSVRAAIAVAIVLLTTTTATAQDARAALERKTRPGDNLTVDLSDTSTIYGRLVTAGADVLTIETLGGRLSLPYAKIDRVRLRRNGVVLGTIIGAAAGLSYGLFVRNALEPEWGDGDVPMILIIATGVGVGYGFDALMSLNRTIYRRPAATVGLQLMPRSRGATAGVHVRW